MRLDSASDAFALGYLSRAVRFDLGKICSRGKPCGNSCVPRKRKCKSETSGLAQELSVKARSQLIQDLKVERDQKRAARASKRQIQNSSTKRVTDFAQTWQKAAFDKAPDDLKRAIAAIDDPVDAEENAAPKVAYFSPQKRGLELDGYESGDTKGQIVYRHEYGHHLDYELGSQKIRKFDETLRSLGYNSLRDLTKESDPQKADAVVKLLREKFQIPDNGDSPTFLLRENVRVSGSGYISDSIKGRAAFGADDKYLRDWKARAESSYLQNLEKNKDNKRIQQLMAARSANTSASYEPIELAKDFAHQDVVDMFNQVALKQNRNRDEVAREYLEQKFGDRDDVYGDLYRQAKSSGYFEKTPGDPKYFSKLKSVRDRAIPFVILERHQDPEVLAELADMVRGGYMGNVRDLTGSITLNAVSSGHASRYYQRGPHLKYTEAFANLTDLHGAGSKLEQRLAETFAPEGYKFFKKVLEDAGRV